MPGVPAARRAAPALRAPCQQPGTAAATRGGLARDVVPGERSSAGHQWLLGLGGLCQLGSHILQVFSSPLLRGVPGHVWLERLILDYLEARESLRGGQGPVRIGAALLPAGTAGLGWPWCQLGPSLQHLLELQRGAGYHPARLATAPQHHQLGREGMCALGGGAAGEEAPPGVEMQRRGKSQGHEPGRVLQSCVCAWPARGWGLGPGL